MVSIGGITYTDAWNQALAQNATLLGQRAAALATQLGVGVEIDYEENTNPNLAGLQSFIDAYRAVHPYDATGNDHTARLTIDTAAGDRWLIGDQPQGDCRLAADRHTGPRLRQRDGPGAPAERQHGDRELAGAHRRQAAIRAAGPAAGARQVHRIVLCRRGIERSGPSATTTAPR